MNVKIWKKLKFLRLFVVLLTVFQSLIGAKTAFAETETVGSQIVPGERGTVIYNQDEVFTMYGTKHGEVWSDKTSTMLLQTESGQTEIIFCIEPGIPLPDIENQDYEAIETDAVNHRAQVAAAIWTRVFPNQSTHEQIVTQAVIWENLSAYGLNITSIDGIPNFAELKAQLNQAINDYNQKPVFHDQTIELDFGQTIQLDSGGVNLNLFDTVIENSANMDCQIAEDGQLIAFTPTDATKQTGSFVAKSSYMEGTPIAFEKEGSQTVMVARIRNTNQYTVNFNIRTTGNVLIQKIDKDSGQPVTGTKFEVEINGEIQEVETDAEGQAVLDKIAHGTLVKATEIFVPAPYVLGSAIGESDVLEGTVTAGETLTLTQHNSKALGKIIVEKSGELSRKDLWNEHYSLAGNIFEIRKETKDGEVVQELTTNEEGIAESEANLPLGIYVVTEKQASQGFVNSFEPVTVEIEYADQTKAVVIENTKGTNKEVTGSTLLTKEDTETEKEAQGKASLVGAEYALLYEDGTPVKWSDASQPVLTNGTQLENNEIVVRVDDESLSAGIERLPLGKYVWKETKAPEGYQKAKDLPFEITYKDQHTEVIVTDQTSKENVIKFTLQGFKYVQSKSQNTHTGYNDIEFSLTPMDGTKGAVQTTTTQRDPNGEDGYWSFSEVPYGDYVLSEVTAPDGYKKIKDLLIESNYDTETNDYRFTITEQGQEEPLKTVTVPADEIHEGSNIVSLSKLYLQNDLVKVPLIHTLATVNDEKTFKPSKETPMQDKISLSNLYEGESYTNKIKLWRIQNEDYPNAQVVFETEKDFVAEAENMEEVIETIVDTTKDDEKTKYVFTEELFDETGEKVAEHNDLKNEEQTIRPASNKKPEQPKTPDKQTETKQRNTPKKQFLPQTSGRLTNYNVLMGIGFMVLVSVGTFIYYKKRNRK